MSKIRQAEGQLMAKMDNLPGKGSAALFSSGEDVRVVAVPTSPAEIVVAGDRPHLKPIFHVLQKRRPFWMFQFEHNFSRILLSDGFDLKVVRSFSSFYLPNGEWDLKLLKRMQKFTEQNPVPVMIAGSPTFTAIARLALEDSNLMKRGLIGTTSAYDCEQLMRLGTDIVEHHFESMAKKRADVYNKAKTKGRVTTDPETIVKALQNDEVAHLFLASDMSMWGRIAWDEGVVKIHPSQDDAHDNDVLGLIAQRAYKDKTRFTLLPINSMPENAPMAAILKSAQGVASDLKAVSRLASFPAARPRIARHYPVIA